MESLDRRIIEALAVDSSAPLTDLSERLGVPSSTLHQRIKKLEARGVIRGYRAVIDQREVGLALHALISLTPIDPARPDDIAEKLAQLEEVESCWSVAGVESYIVKVAVSEPTELEELLGRIRLAANVSTRTTIILSTPFEGRQALIPEEN
ncbi:MAG: Lrp/AsnC family transcriptional regulator [Actinomycetales bacterium]|nr:Lrp/AsnC family transcriptional regulator [Actinomycetales bacterium]